jgi:hypothetical protein
MTTKFIASLIGSALMLAPIAVVGTAALVATTTSAFAIGEPIPGIDIVVKKNPGPIVVRTQTDARGNFKLGNLAPGRYEIELQSFSWGTTNAKRDPNTNEQPRIIGILVGLLLPAVQKTVVSSQQTVSPGKSVSIPFTIPETEGPAKNHGYIGTVTLVK